ncbi:MAG: type I 3-dehydroquinate dehydratase [Thermoplasmata archaeon]|nr:type I 3-dehydroquinate dehydratase [Thermoplasmata archaeon]
MSDFRPKLVVSLPARTIAEAARQVGAARAAGGDLAELRLDRWSPAEQEHVHQLFPSDLPLVATLRSRAEGGSGPDAPGERESLLMNLANEPFAFVDLEVARDRRLEERVTNLGRNIVRSSHLPEGIPMDEIRGRLSEPPPPPGILKVVVPATLSTAVGELLPLLDHLPDPRPALMTTGPSGALVRALARELRVPWVFCSLPEAGAPGTVEASQIPVDRMARFDSADGAPLFAVVGHPVAHSLSPRIHHDWMAREDRIGLYLPIDLSSPEEFRRALEYLPAHGFLGLNVTHPWKHLAYEAATLRSADAIASGIANCLSFRDGGILADNTDLEAMVRRLTELREAGDWDGTALTVLGGGGAARATLAAAQQIGSRATVLTRRPSVATTLAAEFDARSALPEGVSSLVVNATSVGRAANGPFELPLGSFLSGESYVLDWVYAPDDPQVGELARSVGARYEDGRRLLVYQAAATYRVWWGEPPEPESVETIVKELTCGA